MLVPGGPSEKSSTFAEDFELSGSRLRLKIRVWALGVRTFETQREVLTRFPWLLVKAGIRRDTRIYIYIWQSHGLFGCCIARLPKPANSSKRLGENLLTSIIDGACFGARGNEGDGGMEGEMPAVYTSWRSCTFWNDLYMRLSDSLEVSHYL